MINFLLKLSLFGLILFNVYPGWFSNVMVLGSLFIITNWTYYDGYMNAMEDVNAMLVKAKKD